jgi:hypothetical protein
VFALFRSNARFFRLYIFNLKTIQANCAGSCAGGFEIGAQPAGIDGD